MIIFSAFFPPSNLQPSSVHTMDFPCIPPFNDISSTTNDQSFAYSKVEPKRSVGRPKGSKNKPKILPPPLSLSSPRLLRHRPSLNHAAATEIPAYQPTILHRVKRPVGRPKGSKKKPMTPTPTPTTTLPLGTWSSPNAMGGKRRGRPKGSKNKLKMTTSHDSSETILYVPAEVDMAQWLQNYCNTYHACLTVINATGELADVVSYYQPSSFISGPYAIRSLSCTVVPTPSYNDPTKLEETSLPMVVSLHGDIIACSGMVAKSARTTTMVKLVVKMTSLCNSMVENDNDAPFVCDNLRPHDLTFTEFYGSFNPYPPLDDSQEMISYANVCNDQRPQDVSFSEYCNYPFNALENVQAIHDDNYPAENNSSNQETAGSFSKLLNGNDDSVDDEAMISKEIRKYLEEMDLHHQANSVLGL